MENPQTPSPGARHVGVLGAGIIGLATAWQLQRAGHQVTVVDRATAGAGASGANGAQLSYAYVQPLADPSIWRQLPKLLLAPDSPLQFKLQLDPRQWAWGLQFLAACRASVSEQTTHRLLALAGESRAGFDAWLQATGAQCDHTATGKLVLYEGAQGFAAACRQMALQQRLGSVQAALSPAECVQVEPALAHYAPRVAGGIHTPGECAADCFKVCQALHDQLVAGGARMLLGADITRLEGDGTRVVAVETSQGRITADAFVVSLGTGSPALVRPLGVTLPVYPLKGYSITVPVEDGTATAAHPGRAAPRVSVTDAARKVVFARVGQRLRVAGMVELRGEDRRIEPGRIASLVATARDIFPQGGDYDQAEPWAGLRPATPRGEPVIGVSARGPQNLVLNTGHGALGFTLAFGSALRVARRLRC